MLTGDSRATADAVARTLGLDEVHAGVLPNQKGEIVKRLQAEGHVVAMAGDGVNDATALTQANVGIGRIRRHSANRIFGRTFIRSLMAFVPVSTVVPMNHVRTAAEAHHQ